MKIITGKTSIDKKRFGIVVSRFNDFITKRMLDACLKQLTKFGVKDGHVTVIWVPGAFEIPLVALKLAQKNSIDAVICLGAIIKGETLHFDLVARESARGIQQVAMMTQKPIVFEVLATETIEQADRRSRPNGHNKGREAAQCAIEMVAIIDQLARKG